MKILDFIKKNKSFLVGVFILLAMRWSFADQYRVPSGSMEPGVQVGDHIGVNKMAYDLKFPFTNFVLASMHEPQRGDIVVFTWPVDKKTNFVKRLIGLPGDRIQIKDGFITINGKSLQTTDIYNSTQDILTYYETLGSHTVQVQRLPGRVKSEDLEFVVPTDSYFFMGDNRDDSADSRSWGFVQRAALKGKVLGVLWNIYLDGFVPKMNFSRFLSRLS